METTRAKGLHIEKLAANYLQQQHFSIYKTNFQCRYGEIDLIALHDDLLIFVEVRYRKNKSFGGASASVDQQKQQRIIHTAAEFLHQEPKMNNKDIRFDVIAVEGENAETIDWIQAAFTA